METHTTKHASLFISVLLAALLSHNLLIPVMSASFQDQKHHYSPDPLVSPRSPPHGSPSSSHGSGCNCGGTPPSYGGGTPSHGGGSYNPTPTPPSHSGGTPSHGGGSYNLPPTPPSGGGIYNPPPTPPSGGGSNCGTPPPPSGGGGGGGGGGSGGYHNPPPSAGGSPPTPVIVSPPTTPGVSPNPPTTPGGTVPSPPFLPDPNTPGTCIFWKSHPALIWGLFGWWGTVAGAFGVGGGVPGYGAGLSLLDALSNTRTDALGALYREGTASLLNSMVNKNFHFTSKQVKESFIAALTSNKVAAAQAQMFKLANEGRLKPRA